VNVLFWQWDAQLLSPHRYIVYPIHMQLSSPYGPHSSLFSHTGSISFLLSSHRKLSGFLAATTTTALPFSAGLRVGIESAAGELPTTLHSQQIPNRNQKNSKHKQQVLHIIPLKSQQTIPLLFVTN